MSCAFHPISESLCHLNYIYIYVCICVYLSYSYIYIYPYLKHFLLKYFNSCIVVENEHGAYEKCTNVHLVYIHLTTKHKDITSCWAGLTIAETSPNKNLQLGFASMHTYYRYNYHSNVSECFSHYALGDPCIIRDLDGSSRLKLCYAIPEYQHQMLSIHDVCIHTIYICILLGNCVYNQIVTFNELISIIQPLQSEVTRYNLLTRDAIHLHYFPVPCKNKFPCRVDVLIDNIEN